MVGDACTPEGSEGPRPIPRGLVGLVLGSWVGLVVVARVWGEQIVAGGTGLKLGTPPFHAIAETRLGWLSVLAMVVGGIYLLVVPPAAQRVRLSLLPLVAGLAAITWAVALNSTDGLDGGLLRGFESPRHEYPADVDKIEDPWEFLAGFTEDIDDYVTHVRGHPPGFLLLLWGLDQVGLSGVPAAAGVAVVATGLAAAAVTVALRDVAGERWARRAVPFLGAAPAALWMVSSADAAFAALGAVGGTAVILATSRRGWHADLWALCGGVVLGLALMGSYGMVLVATVPTAVAISRRTARPVAVAAAGGVAVIGAFALAGFWWLDGLATTAGEYQDGIASVRPSTYFLVANLAAFALALGPSTAVGLAALRDRALWLLVGGGLAAVLVADLSGMSKGEVERIWLPFAVWVIPAGAACAVPERAGMVRLWVGLQLAVALTVQTWYVTGW